MGDFNPGYLLNAIIYPALGIVMFFGAFAVATRMIPYDMWKEIGENRNTAMAIMAAALALGIAVIIASAVH